VFNLNIKDKVRIHEMNYLADVTFREIVGEALKEKTFRPHQR
jgi:hypothetical protein